MNETTAPTGLALTSAPDGSPNLALAISYGTYGDYWTALAEARAYWIRIQATAPTLTDEGKLEMLATFNPLVAAVQETAAAAGIAFTMSDIMGL